MLKVLEESSKNIFVPLCVGGGIQDYEDEEGHKHSALDVATCLFRAGADKVSIGSAVSVCVQCACPRWCDDYCDCWPSF